MRRVEELRAAVVGTGFVGLVHVEALRRLGVEVAGVVGSSPERAHAKARSRSRSTRRSRRSPTPPGTSASPSTSRPRTLRTSCSASRTDEGYPTFRDGHRSNVLGDAVLRSAREGRWVEVRP